MPYIPQAERKQLDNQINALAKTIRTMGGHPDGRTNYVLTRLLLQVFELEGSMTYTMGEHAIGCLECCKLELYRRALAPYENLKAKSAGDVYPWVSGGQLPQGVQ